MTVMPANPEQAARENIDRLLTQAGWAVQDIKSTNLHAGPGVAIREFPLATGHGCADYLLYVQGKADGAAHRNPLFTRPSTLKTLQCVSVSLEDALWYRGVKGYREKALLTIGFQS
jgi:hypothetical protein